MKSAISVILLILFDSLSGKVLFDLCTWVNSPTNTDRKLRSYNFQLRQLFYGNTAPQNILLNHDFAKIKRVTANINAQPRQIVIKKLPLQNCNPNMFQALKSFPSSGFLQCQFDESDVFIGFEFFLNNLKEPQFLNTFREKPSHIRLAFYSDLFELVVGFGRLGFVHRNIQPENCLIDANGKPHFSNYDLVEIKGRPDRPIGNPLYMSPARFIADAEADPATDLYSLAVLIFGVESPAGPELLMFDYFQGNRVKLLPMCFEGIMVKSCLRSIRSNVINVFKKPFGEFIQGAGDEQINFTTLILDILRYKSSRDGISALQIMKRLIEQQKQKNTIRI